MSVIRSIKCSSIKCAPTKMEVGPGMVETKEEKNNRYQGKNMKITNTNLIMCFTFAKERPCQNWRPLSKLYHGHGKDIFVIQ